MNDTDKLKLLQEYNLEYYDKPRLYKFVEGGFVSYSLFGTPKGTCMYIAEIFVSREHRGGTALKELVQFCQEVFKENNGVQGFSRTEKSNIHLDSMESMYARVGLIRFKEDEEAYYYRTEFV